MEILLAFFLLTLVLTVLIYGSFKAFQRNWLAALLLLLFFMPGFIAWALIECFTEPVKPKVYNIRIVNAEDLR